MLGFLIAVAAGYFTPQIETAVAVPLEKSLSRHIAILPVERTLLAFMVAVVGAGLAAVVLQSGSAFWVALGASLGYFGPRLVAVVRART